MPSVHARHAVVFCSMASISSFPDLGGIAYHLADGGLHICAGGQILGEAFQNIKEHFFILS